MSVSSVRYRFGLVAALVTLLLAASLWFSGGGLRDGVPVARLAGTDGPSMLGLGDEEGDEVGDEGVAAVAPARSSTRDLVSESVEPLESSGSSELSGHAPVVVGGRLEGVCIRGGEPVFDAEVFAFRHREQDGVEESLWPFYVRGSDPGHITRHMPSGTRVTRSDERGAFAFSGLRAGLYDVVARDPSLVLGYLQRVEIAAVGVQGTVVVMPPHGQLFCELRGVGVVPTSSRLELVLVSDSLKWTGGLRGGGLYPAAREVADVTGDGPLSFSNVPNGPAELFLRIPPVSFIYEPTFPSSGGSESLVSLTRVSVPNTPDSAVLLDVEQLGISWIQVEYDRDAHGPVVASAVKVGSDFLAVGGTYTRPGPVVIGPLTVGYWHVWLEATDMSWRYDHPVAVQVEPGREDAVIQIRVR